MARILSSVVEQQILNKDIKPRFTIKIGGIDYSSYLVSHSLSANTEYGSQSGQFVLHNDDGRFEEGGESPLYINDEVEFYETYADDTYDFKKFRGFIESRSRSQNAGSKAITIVCLDYISVLQHTDVKLQLEADKIEVTDEELVPVNLTTEGETMFAQVFNFANDAIASTPPPTLRIRDKSYNTDDVEYQGFEILNEVGQVKFGAPLNTDNYSVICPSYYHYPIGLYIEDCIEDIIKAELGYAGDYLFGETSSNDVVTNHLRTTYLEEFGLDEYGEIVSYLIPNYTTQTIYVYAQLQSDYNPTQLVTATLAQDYDYAVDDVLYLDDTTGFEDPASGEEYKEILVRGFKMRYTAVGSGNTLTGVTGSYYIKAGATVSYDTGIEVTTLVVDSTEGLPNTGSATISSDTFTWTSKDATHLYGVPTSGENALSSHKTGCYVKYEIECDPGRVWYLQTNNITSTLTSEDFTIPSGYTIDYIDHKFGRIILDSAISLSSILTCDVDYTYSTLQSTGIEINKIDFLERTTSNRYEAIKNLKEFLAPNYILRTQGSDKIYGSYMNQKLVQDYNLSLVGDLSFLEDSDIYTRVVMFGKNKSPRNIMFNEGVNFLTTGESYKSLASNDELVYRGTSDGWHNFETYISRAGYITAEDFPPVVYINNIVVDNEAHQVAAQPVTLEKTTQTVTTVKTDKGGSETSQQTYYYYKIEFAHQSLYSSEPIYVYNSSGELKFTLGPYEENVDYSRGIWNVPGNELNEDVEELSTASYYIFYADNQVKIDYDNVIIQISEALIPDATRVVVNADYEYIHTMTPINGINKVYDGRWDTQVQTEFFSNPPTNYNYAILDLGQVYDIQAIDIVAGFYRPDDIRKFDIGFRATIWYSTDNTNYYRMSDAATGFDMQGGSSISFEDEDISKDGTLSVRYLKLTLDNVTKIDYGDGLWVVALTEIAVYTDIILRSEAKLIPMTYNDSPVDSEDTSMSVISTNGFTEPGSGETVTAYIDDNAFTYTGLTATSFTGVTIGSGESYSTDSIVSKSVREDPDIYDYNQLYYRQKDRVYKYDRSDNGYLYSQEDLDNITQAFLEEFVKNTTAVQIQIIFVPYLNIGDSVYLSQTGLIYFVSAIQSSGANYMVTLNYYPAA